MEQARKVSNFYFLIVLIIQVTPTKYNVSPLGWITSGLPLFFVLATSMIRAGVEDVARHRSDKRTATAPYDVVDEGGLRRTASAELRVGDIVRLERDQAVPADMVLLSSTNEEGLAFIGTADLDGETNLKMRRATEATTSLNTPETAAEADFRVEFEGPNADMYAFSGRIVDGFRSTALDLKQFLPRGAVMRNTEAAFGIVSVPCLPLRARVYCY